MIRKLAFCLVAVFALSAHGLAAVPSMRPCGSSDLGGIYVLTQYKEIGGQGFSRSASHFRYHFLELTPPGTWVEHSMNRMPADPALIGKILGNDPKDRSYSLDADGRLVVKHGDQISFTGRCAVSLSDRQRRAPRRRSAKSRLHRRAARWRTEPSRSRQMWSLWDRMRPPKCRWWSRI